MFVRSYIGKLFFIFNLLFFLSLFFSFSRADNVGSPYIEGEVIVKYKDDFQKTLSEFGVKTIDNHSLHLFKGKGKSTQELVDEFENNPDVEYAEPNYLYTIYTNDTYYDNLWGFENVNDNDIDWEEAIDFIGTGMFSGLTYDNPGSIIAVIDNGVDSSHIDLQNQMWYSDDCKDEYGASIGVCSGGYNFVDNIHGSISACPTYVGAYHGTHVAGSLGAEGWNNQGIVGVNPGVNVMGLFAGYCDDGSSDVRSLSLSAIISAINFSRHNGVKIINASFGGGAYSTLLRDAIEDFVDGGGIFVAAAGNDGQNHDAGYHAYPCDYSLDGIVCVAATDNNDNMSYFSDYGISSVDIAAPGSNIYSTALSNSYEYHAGTSMATPYVAGLISLAWSYRPDLTNEEIISNLFGTVEKLSSLSGKISTEGKINVYNLMNSLSFSDVTLFSPLSGEIVRGELSLIWSLDTGDYISGYNYYISNNTDFSPVVLSGFTIETGIDLVLEKGTYYWGVQAINDFGLKGDMITGVFYYGGLSAICDSVISGIFVGGNFDDLLFVDDLNSQHFGIVFDSQVFSSGYSGYQQINQINIYYSTGDGLNLFATGLSPLDVSGNVINMSGQDFGAYFSGDIAYIQTYDHLNNLVLGSSLPYVSGLFISLGLIDVDGYEVISEVYPISFRSDFLLDSKSITVSKISTNELGIDLALRYPDDMSYFLFGSGLNMSGAIWNTSVNQTGFVGDIFGYKNIDAILSTGDGNKEISVVYYRSGFVSEVYTSSIILDTTNLGATVVYSITGATNQDVVATIILNESGYITNNSGNNEYIFTGNGSFVFEFEDLVGNIDQEIVTVDWVDKIKPMAVIDYISGTGMTTGNVAVLITGFSEQITGLNATGYTFTENGFFVFEYEDLVGNTGETVVAVDWIDRNPPIILGITDTSTYTTSVYLDNVLDYPAGVQTVLLDGNVLFDWVDIEIDEIGDHVLFVEDVLGNNSSIRFTIKKKNSGGGGGGGGSTIVYGTEDNEEEIILTGEFTVEIIDESIVNNGTYILSGDILKSPYSDELNNAYVYAYSQNITTKETVLDANMEGSLIRSHMSKMMSNFAMNVLGRKPDLTKKCQFSDTDNQSDEMKSYIVLSCQLGLMGVGTEKFFPKTEVTRAQFGTVLSRAIWGDKFNSTADLYYEGHLAALKAAGIMTKIENPGLQELRGWVMLMLMRVDEKF